MPRRSADAGLLHTCSPESLGCWDVLGRGACVTFPDEDLCRGALSRYVTHVAGGSVSRVTPHDGRRVYGSPHVDPSGLPPPCVLVPRGLDANAHDFAVTTLGHERPSEPGPYGSSEFPNVGLALGTPSQESLLVRLCFKRSFIYTVIISIIWRLQCVSDVFCNVLFQKVLPSRHLACVQ